MTRREMIDRFWATVEPTIDGYSEAIHQLLNTLSDGQLEGLLPEEDEGDDDGGD